MGKVQSKRTEAQLAQEKADREHKEREARKAAAPARWAEQRKLFDSVVAEINSKIEAIDQKIVLQALSAVHHSIAKFKISLFNGSLELDHYYECEVGLFGRLSASRRMPGVWDRQEILSDKLDDRSVIQQFLLEYLENVQGLRSQEQMAKSLSPQ